MSWSHAKTMSTSDDGAMVIESEDGWEAYPGGSHGGCAGVFTTREEACDAADWQVKGADCCKDP